MGFFTAYMADLAPVIEADKLLGLVMVLTDFISEVLGLFLDHLDDKEVLRELIKRLTTLCVWSAIEGTYKILVFGHGF